MSLARTSGWWSHDERTYTNCVRCVNTQRIAFFAGTRLGVIIAALGIRVLELSVDPAAFEMLPRVQQRLFRTALST